MSLNIVVPVPVVQSSRTMGGEVVGFFRQEKAAL